MQTPSIEREEKELVLISEFVRMLDGNFAVLYFAHGFGHGLGPPAYSSRTRSNADGLDQNFGFPHKLRLHHLQVLPISGRDGENLSAAHPFRAAAICNWHD